MTWFEEKMENDRKELASHMAGLGLANLGDFAATNEPVPHVTYGTTAQLILKCAGGYIVAYPAGDAGVFDEIGIDFVTDDGRAMQLAVIGKDEGNDDYHPEGTPDYQPMHVYAYDGQSGDVEDIQYVRIDEESHWYN